MAFAGLSTVLVYKKEKCLVKSGKDTQNLAVLIAERCAPKSQDFVDYRTHKKGKMLPHVKYSSKRSDFLRFYAYLCHVIDDFLLLVICSTKVSEKSDMAKS